MVFAATSGGDVHDARPLFGTNITPRDHAVRGAIGTKRLRNGWGSVERRAVAPAHQLAPLLGLKDRGARCTTAERGDAARGTDPHLASVEFHQFIRECWVHRSGNVGRNRPRCCRPGEELFARSIDKGESEVGRWIIAIGVPFGHLVLADTGTAPRAPRHAVAPLIEPSPAVAFSEEAPDQVVVLIGEGEVRAADLGRTELSDQALWRSANLSSSTRNRNLSLRCGAQCVAQAKEVGWIIPIHPHAEPNGLLGLSSGIREHALLAETDELGEATLFNLSL